MTKLPDKLHELLALGLKDLESIQKIPNISIYMSFWLRQWSDNECSVCLAGAVMYQTLGSRPDCINDERTPCDFNEDTRRKLNALNHLRMGNIGNAMWALRMDDWNHPDIEVPDYDEESIQEWWDGIRQVHAYLVEKDL